MPGIQNKSNIYFFNRVSDGTKKETQNIGAISKDMAPNKRSIQTPATEGSLKS